MSNEKSWINSGWAIGIGCTLLSVILPGIYDKIESRPFFSTVWHALKWCWSAIISILNFDIKVWWLLVGTIGIVALYIFFLKEEEQEEDSMPVYYNYREDIFHGWKYTWRWVQNSDLTWRIHDLKAHCKRENCDTTMVYDNPLYRCPRCDFSPYPNGPRMNDAQHLILDTANKMCDAKQNN